MKSLYYLSVLFLMINTSNAQWTSLNSNTTKDLKSVYFTHPDTGYAVGTEGLIIQTTNGGSSWTTQVSNTTDALSSLYFNDSKNGFAVGANGIILKTINSGSEWVKQTSNTTNQLNSVFFIDQNHGNIVGFNGDFLYTSDGGVTWRVRTGPKGNIPYAMSLYFCDNDTGYAFGAYTAFYSTTDSGNNWEGKIIIDVTNPPPNKHLRCGYFVDCNIGYAVGTNYYNTYSKELILKTTNGGKDWIDLTTYSFNELNSVWFVDANNGYAVGSKGTIIKTTNGGTNWSIQTSGTIKDLFSVFFTSPDTGYIVGNNGTILKTLNGGLAWVKDELKADLINIFPNPSSSKLNIESTDINKEMIITILNINGQEILYRSIKDNKFQIDIGDLNSGIYFVKLVIDNKVEFKKIIKK